MTACKTCGGTGKVVVPFYVNGAQTSREIPCPDCKPSGDCPYHDLDLGVKISNCTCKPKKKVYPFPWIVDHGTHIHTISDGTFVAVRDQTPARRLVFTASPEHAEYILSHMKGMGGSLPDCKPVEPVNVEKLIDLVMSLPEYTDLSALARAASRAEANIRQLAKENEKLKGHIQWMSGSPSFGPEGEAFKGWLKVRKKESLNINDPE